MTDQSKPMHEQTSTRESRPQQGGTSGGQPKSPIPAKPTHGDPDRRSIGDENDRGLRQDTQSDDSDESSERSGSSEKRGKPMQQGTPAVKSNEPRKEGGERSAPGREGQAKQNDSQGERRSK